MRNVPLSGVQATAAALATALAAAGAEAIGPNRIALNPDCGFAPNSAEPPTIDEAYEKLKRLAEAAARLRLRFRLR